MCNQFQTYKCILCAGILTIVLLQVATGVPPLKPKQILPIGTQSLAAISTKVPRIARSQILPKKPAVLAKLPTTKKPLYLKAAKDVYPVKHQTLLGLPSLMRKNSRVKLPIKPTSLKLQKRLTPPKAIKRETKTYTLPTNNVPFLRDFNYVVRSRPRRRNQLDWSFIKNLFDIKPTYTTTTSPLEYMDSSRNQDNDNENTVDCIDLETGTTTENEYSGENQASTTVRYQYEGKTSAKKRTFSKTKGTRAGYQETTTVDAETSSEAYTSDPTISDQEGSYFTVGLKRVRPIEIEASTNRDWRSTNGYTERYISSHYTDTNRSFTGSDRSSPHDTGLRRAKEHVHSKNKRYYVSRFGRDSPNKLKKEEIHSNESDLKPTEMNEENSLVIETLRQSNKKKNGTRKTKTQAVQNKSTESLENQKVKIIKLEASVSEENSLPIELTKKRKQKTNKSETKKKNTVRRKSAKLSSKITKSPKFSDDIKYDDFEIEMSSSKDKNKIRALRIESQEMTTTSPLTITTERESSEELKRQSHHIYLSKYIKPTNLGGESTEDVHLQFKEIHDSEDNENAATSKNENIEPFYNYVSKAKQKKQPKKKGVDKSRSESSSLTTENPKESEISIPREKQEKNDETTKKVSKNEKNGLFAEALHLKVLNATIAIGMRKKNGLTNFGLMTL